MAIFLDHINVTLSKLRADPVTSLSADTTTEAYRAAIAVRRAVWRVWNAKQWAFKLRRTNLALTASSNEYVLPKIVGEPLIVMSSVSPYRLTVVKEDTFDKFVPNPQASGNPEFVRLFEMTGAENQPSSASVISVASNSASDTTQKILIKGFVNGEIDYEELSLSGISTVSTTKLFSEIYAISKSDDTAGKITITAGATTIGTLSTQERVLRLRKLRFYPAPGSAITMTIKHLALPPLLTHAYEDTEIPVRWDYVVDQFALAFALQAKGQEQITEQSAEFQLAELFLKEDMVSEEYLSGEEIILPERVGGTGDSSWLNQLSGFGYTYY